MNYDEKLYWQKCSQYTWWCLPFVLEICKTIFYTGNNIYGVESLPQLLILLFRPLVSVLCTLIPWTVTIFSHGSICDTTNRLPTPIIPYPRASTTVTIQFRPMHISYSSHPLSRSLRFLSFRRRSWNIPNRYQRTTSISHTAALYSPCSRGQSGALSPRKSISFACDCMQTNTYVFAATRVTLWQLIYSTISYF